MNKNTRRKTAGLALALCMSVSPVNTYAGSPGAIQTTAGIPQTEKFMMQGNTEQEYLVMTRDLDEITKVAGGDAVTEVLVADQETDAPAAGESGSCADTPVGTSGDTAEAAVVSLTPWEAARLETGGAFVEKDESLSAFTSSAEGEQSYKSSEADETADDEGRGAAGPQGTAGPQGAAGHAADEWNLAMTQAQDYTDVPAEDGKVKVAVLDSGVNDRSDIRLEGNVSMTESYDDCGFRLLQDATGHGTAIASLISGGYAKENALEDESVRGMNRDAQIYSVQVLDSNNAGKLGSIIKGIYWAIDNGMDIINMSFGTPKDSELLHEAVKEAAEAGIVMVAAAGNTPGVTMYPAGYDEVISVGAATMEGDIAEDSARGADVDIYAPGENILADDPLYSRTIVSGTSIACAEVTAAASIILEQNRKKNPAFVKGLLMDSANQGFAESREKDAGLLVSNGRLRAEISAN